MWKKKKLNPLEWKELLDFNKEFKNDFIILTPKELNEQPKPLFKDAIIDTLIVPEKLELEFKAPPFDINYVNENLNKVLDLEQDFFNDYIFEQWSFSLSFVILEETIENKLSLTNFEKLKHLGDSLEQQISYFKERKFFIKFYYKHYNKHKKYLYPLMIRNHDKLELLEKKNYWLINQLKNLKNKIAILNQYDKQLYEQIKIFISIGNPIKIFLLYDILSHIIQSYYYCFEVYYYPYYLLEYIIKIYILVFYDKDVLFNIFCNRLPPFLQKGDKKLIYNASIENDEGFYIKDLFLFSNNNIINQINCYSLFGFWHQNNFDKNNINHVLYKNFFLKWTEMYQYKKWLNYNNRIVDQKIYLYFLLKYQLNINYINDIDNLKNLASYIINKEQLKSLIFLRKKKIKDLYKPNFFNRHYGRRFLHKEYRFLLVFGHLLFEHHAKKHWNFNIIYKKWKKKKQKKIFGKIIYYAWALFKKLNLLMGDDLFMHMLFDERDISKWSFFFFSFYFLAYEDKIKGFTFYGYYADKIYFRFPQIFFLVQWNNELYLNFNKFFSDLIYTRYMLMQTLTDDWLAKRFYDNFKKQWLLNNISWFSLLNKLENKFLLLLNKKNYFFDNMSKIFSLYNSYLFYTILPSSFGHLHSLIKYQIRQLCKFLNLDFFKIINKNYNLLKNNWFFFLKQKNKLKKKFFNLLYINYITFLWSNFILNKERWFFIKSKKKKFFSLSKKQISIYKTPKRYIYRKKWIDKHVFYYGPDWFYEWEREVYRVYFDRLTWKERNVFIKSTLNLISKKDYSSFIFMHHYFLCALLYKIKLPFLLKFDFNFDATLPYGEHSWSQYEYDMFFQYIFFTAYCCFLLKLLNFKHFKNFNKIIKIKRISYIYFLYTNKNYLKGLIKKKKLKNKLLKRNIFKKQNINNFYSEINLNLKKIIILKNTIRSLLCKIASYVSFSKYIIPILRNNLRLLSIFVFYEYYEYRVYIKQFYYYEQNLNNNYLNNLVIQDFLLLNFFWQEDLNKDKIYFINNLFIFFNYIDNLSILVYFIEYSLKKNIKNLFLQFYWNWLLYIYKFIYINIYLFIFYFNNYSLFINSCRNILIKFENSIELLNFDLNSLLKKKKGLFIINSLESIDIYIKLNSIINLKQKLKNLFKLNLDKKKYIYIFIKNFFFYKYKILYKFNFLNFFYTVDFFIFKNKFFKNWRILLYLRLKFFKLMYKNISHLNDDRIVYDYMLDNQRYFLKNNDKHIVYNHLDYTPFLLRQIYIWPEKGEYKNEFLLKKTRVRKELKKSEKSFEKFLNELFKKNPVEIFTEKLDNIFLFNYDLENFKNIYENKIDFIIQISIIFFEMKLSKSMLFIEEFNKDLRLYNKFNLHINYNLKTINNLLKNSLYIYIFKRFSKNNYKLKNKFPNIFFTKNITKDNKKYLSLIEKNKFFYINENFFNLTFNEFLYQLKKNKGIIIINTFPEFVEVCSYCNCFALSKDKVEINLHLQNIYYNDEDSFSINKFTYKFCSICSLYKVCISNEELLYFISYKKFFEYLMSNPSITNNYCILNNNLIGFLFINGYIIYQIYSIFSYRIKNVEYNFIFFFSTNYEWHTMYDILFFFAKAFVNFFESFLKYINIFEIYTQPLVIRMLDMSYENNFSHIEKKDIPLKPFHEELDISLNKRFIEKKKKIYSDEVLLKFKKKREEKALFRKLYVQPFVERYRQRKRHTYRLTKLYLFIWKFLNLYKKNKKYNNFTFINIYFFYHWEIVLCALRLIYKIKMHFLNDSESSFLIKEAVRFSEYEEIFFEKFPLDDKEWEAMLIKFEICSQGIVEGGFLQPDWKSYFTYIFFFLTGIKELDDKDKQFYPKQLYDKVYFFSLLLFKDLFPIQKGIPVPILLLNEQYREPLHIPLDLKLDFVEFNYGKNMMRLIKREENNYEVINRLNRYDIDIIENYESILNLENINYKENLYDENLKKKNTMILKNKNDYLWKENDRILSDEEFMKKITTRDIKNDRKINYAEAMGEFYNINTSSMDYIIKENNNKKFSKFDAIRLASKQKENKEELRKELINKLDYEMKTGNFIEDELPIFNNSNSNSSAIIYDKLSGGIITEIELNKDDDDNIFEDEYNLSSLIDLNIEELINSFDLINGLEFLMHAIRMQVNACAGDMYFDYYYEKTGMQDIWASLVYCVGEQKYDDNIIREAQVFEVSLDLLFKYQNDIQLRNKQQFTLLVI